MARAVNKKTLPGGDHPCQTMVLARAEGSTLALRQSQLQPLVKPDGLGLSDAGAMLQLEAQEHSRDNHQGLQLFALLWGRATGARARPDCILRWACFTTEEAELRRSG